MRNIGLVMAILLLGATGAPCDTVTWVASGATAVGDSVRINVTVAGGTALAGMSVVVEADMLGACDAAAIVTPVPAPIAAQDAEQSFRFMVKPAEAGRIYFYRAKLVDAGGGILPAPTSPYHANGSYKSCGEGIVARGMLVSWLLPGPQGAAILNCAGQCWATCGPMIVLPADTSAWMPHVDSGQVLDLYGEVMPPPTLWTMPGTPCLVIERIAPVTDPAGCAAVAEERATWGSVKALYR